MKEKQKLDKICITLYIIAALFGIYTIFSFVNTSFYISDLMAQGLDIGSNMANIISYFVTACGPYIFYTVVLGVMGLEASKFHAYLGAKNGEIKETVLDVVSDDDEAVKSETGLNEDVVEVEFVEVKEDETKEVFTEIEAIKEEEVGDEALKTEDVKTLEA